MPLSNGVRNRRVYFAAQIVEQRTARLKEKVTTTENCSWCDKKYSPFENGRPSYCCDTCARAGKRENEKFQKKSEGLLDERPHPIESTAGADEIRSPQRGAHFFTPMSHWDK